MGKSWISRASDFVKSKADDAWDRGYEVGRGPVRGVKAIGEAGVELAEAPFSDDEYDGFLGTIYDIATKRGGEALGGLLGPKTGAGAFVGALPGVIRRPGRDVLGPVMRFSDRAYNDAISRPISTALTAGSLADAPGGGGVGGLFRGENWREAWKLADARSPGQALALAIGTKDINDKKEVERFMATDHYRQWSGMADAVFRMNLDPTIVAGKATTAVRGSMLATDAETGARTLIPKAGLATQEQVAAARDSTRVARFVDRVENIVEEHGDGASARIRHEMFPNHQDGAYLSDLLAKAPDTVTRRRIVGSSLGSAEDFAALTQDAPAIAHQLRNLTSDAFDALQQEKGMLGPGRAEQLAVETDALYAEQDRVAKIIATHGTLSEVPGASSLAQARAGITSSNLYQKNPLTAPLRTVTNMLPQHWLNLNDPRGDIQVARMLQQSGLDGETQSALRSSYMGEVSAAGRQRVALDIEKQVVQATLDKYDVPKWIVDDVLSNAPRLREEATGALSRRQYDAAGRGSVLLPPGPDGTITRLHLPLHVTQQADLLPLVDIKDLERAAQAVKGWNWDAGVWDSVRNKYEETRLGFSGTKKAQAIALAGNAPAEALEVFYGLWRPATLLRVGWPVRILMDEQLRILSKIGAMSHGAQLGGAAARSIKQRLTPWEFVTDEGEKVAGRGLPTFAEATSEQVGAGLVARGTGEYETMLKLRSGHTVTLPPAFGTPGDAAEVFKRLNSSSGAFRELAVGEEDALLKSFRKHTGSWTSFTPDHGDYPAIWTQTVNRQLKQSAFARQFLAGASVDDAAGWLAKTDEGIAYAREMGWRPDSFLRHAEDVGDQVGRYVPTPELRTKLLGGKVTHADLARAVPDQIARPAVHGEELAQALGQSGISKAVRNVRDGLFKWLGQVPTDVLSRNPFFDSMYRMESERLANLADDGARQAGRVLGEEDLAGIASKARRFALNQSQDLLYDLAEKSHLAHMLRFVAPFYMAWQEVLTRWAGIAVDNPAFVARMRQVWDAPEKAGLVSDEHGRVVNEHGQATDPLTGETVKAGADRFITLPFSIPGLPTHGKVRFNKKSLNMALQGMPGVGPPVQIAVNEIVKEKPDLEKSVKFILPFGASQSTLQLLLPGTAKRGYALSQGEDDRQYANTLNRIMGDRMTDYMLGKRKNKPAYAEVKKATDHLYMLRTVASWVSPVSPIFDSPYQPFINAYRNGQERLRNDEHAFGTHPDGSAIGVDEWFLDSYGEEYFWLTQSLTKTSDGIQPTAEGFDARKRYKDLIEQHPDLGGLIVGNEGNGQYSSGVYQSQLAHDTRPGSGIKQREPLTFDEYTAQPEVRLGWLKYSQAMDTIESERVKRGLPNMQVKAAGDLAVLKRLVTQKLAEQYPAWMDEFSQQDTQKWNKRIAGMREIVADKRLAGRDDRPDIKGLGVYLQARDAVTAELAQRRSKTLGSASNQDLASIWETLRSAIVEKYVAFAPIFYRYLERDPVLATPDAGGQ